MVAVETTEQEATQPEIVPAEDVGDSSQTGIEAEVSSVNIDDDQPTALDQGTLFRAVSSMNLNAVSALLRNRKIDINGYDREGLTPLMHSVYGFERSHNTDLVQLLLDAGAKATVRTLPASSADAEVKKCFVRKDLKMETRKVSLSNKTPLLAALEFKSSLYLRGWEYRHWDSLLHLLAVTTRAELAQRSAGHPPPTLHEAADAAPPAYSLIAAATSSPGSLARTSSVSTPNSASPSVSAAAAPAGLLLPSVEDGWSSVFASGKHELVEVWAEGQHVEALKLLLVTASKRFRFELEKAAALSSHRLTISDASFTIVKTMVEFLYSGQVAEPFMQQRGVDLLLAANKYDVVSLKQLCEEELVPNQDNWIKMLSVALECNSTVLEAKVATSIRDVMENRSVSRRFVRPKYAASLHPEGGPSQLSLMSTVYADHA